MLRIESNDGIDLVRIEHGKVNAVDYELLEGLRDALGELRQRDTRAVILTGSGSVFSAGVDLFRVLDGGVEYLNRFLPVLSTALREIAQFPKPLIAAINGHAIAGGCILACACDYKIMAAGTRRIGVPELRVGVPFPAVPFEILRMAVPRRHLQEVVLLGRTYLPEEGKRRGLVDEVVPVADLEERASEVAREMAEVGAEAFAVSKRQLRHQHWEAMRLAADQFDAEVEALWKAREAHQAIQSYLDKTVGKKQY